MTKDSMFRTTAFIAVALLVAACGGSIGSDDTADSGTKRTAAFTPIEPSCCTVNPLGISGVSDATVGNAAGVVFSGFGTGGFPPYTYRWSFNTVVIPGATGVSYSIPSASAASIGNYTLRVTDRFGQVATKSARLMVVSNAWAQLGGRSFMASSAPLQPSIALCNGRPTVAWIITSAAGVGLLYVSQFNGATWASPGGAVLNVSTSASAAQPSLDCLDGHNTASHPIVAWVEGTGNARNVYTKYWDGVAWQLAGNGALNFTANSNVEKPVLRTNYYNPPTIVRDPVVTRLTSIAWIENGVPSLRVWNNGGWQAYAGGQGPGGANAKDIALTIDLGRGNAYPPVVAWLQQNGASLQPFVGIHDGGTWTQIGQPASFSIANATANGRIGIGIGKLSIDVPQLRNDGRIPVVWFADAAAPSTFRSFFLNSGSYGALDVGARWTVYGDPLSVGSAPVTTAYDPREFAHSDGVICSFDLPTFGLAIALGTSFEVRRGNCGLQNAPASWPTVRPALNESLKEIGMRLAAADNPYVVGVKQVAVGSSTQYQLSTWKFYP